MIAFSINLRAELSRVTFVVSRVTLSGMLKGQDIQSAIGSSKLKTVNFSLMLHIPLNKISVRVLGQRGSFEK